MAVQANVAFFKNEFIATLSDGRHFELSGLHEMANALYRAGVTANSVQYEWQSGWRMITAGQQVALRAAIRQHERGVIGLGIAA
ncbi:MAG TPA: hypothetical protein VLA64_04405 [Azonexus sp.]|nr:hypothetical protein [Azonexus sp.]